MHKQVLKALLIACLLTAGCGQESTKKQDSSAMENSVSELKESASKTIGAAKDVSEQAQKEFVGHMNEKLNSIESSFQELKSQVEDLNAQAQGEISAALNQIAEKKAAFSKALSEFQMNPEKTRETIKGQVSNALKEVEDALSKLRDDLESGSS